MSKLAVSTLIVSDIMTPNPILFSSNMLIRDVMYLLIEKGISGGPVVQPGSRRIISTISESNLVRFGAMDGLDLQLIEFLPKLPTRKELITVSPHDPFSEVFKKFITTPMRRMPVVDDLDLVMGMVSRRDILRAFLESKKTT